MGSALWVECPKCGYSKTILPSVVSWKCPNCKRWCGRNDTPEEEP